MLRKLALPGGIVLAYVLGLLTDIVADITLMPFDPYLRPVLEQLFPFLGQQVQSMGQQIQSILNSLNERDIKTVIQYAGSREVDRASIILVTLWSMFFFGAFVLIGTQFASVRLHLIERENPMKLLSKFVSIVFIAVVIAYIVITLLGWRQLRLMSVAVRINQIFEHNLSVVGPYILEQEERELRSKFALMKSREDIQAIDAKLLPIMEQHGISVSKAK
jgi:hypothetical protein